MPLDYLGWEGLAAAAAFIGVLGALLLYMLSRIFNLPQLEQAAKSELIFAASTIVLVSSVIFLVDAGTLLVRDIGISMYSNSLGVDKQNVILRLQPPNNTLIDLTKLYLAPVIDCGKIMLLTLYAISIPVEAISSVYMEIFMSEHASGFGMKVISERIKNTTEIITFYIFIYYFIIHILNFIKYYWSFFLAIGIACRAFPLTRGAGAYIMAISLGLYFVFPFSYILVGSVVSSFVKSDYYNATNMVCLAPDIPTDIKACTKKGDIAEVTDAALWLETHRKEIASFWNVFTPSILRHITSVICFIPFITLMITLSFVLSSTSLFGGAIPEVSRGLIKLI